MKWLFWGSAAIIAYTYLGYAGWLWVRARLRPRPVLRGVHTPFVSVVMVVRNEAGVLEQKMRNLLELEYPGGEYEIVIFSDGSNDGTNEILTAYAKVPQMKVLLGAHPQGKPTGLNQAVAASRGEIVVFTDARQKIASNALRLLMENFVDASVGCASGELMLGDPDSGEVGQGMGLYWKVEKQIRELESASGSVVGATGALYAVRRALLVPVPAETVLDDVYLPMHVVRQGARVVFDPRAHAWDVADQGSEREFARKVRTLSGNYQLLQLAPWLLSGADPIRFEFISHKLLRLLAPFALATVLIASCFLPQPIYRLALALQLAFYALGLLALAHMKNGPVARLADAAFTFVVLNGAALVAFANFVTGRKVAWGR